MINASRLIHDPDITSIDDDGNFRVDLLKLAIKAGAPLTQKAIDHLSILVQREFRSIYPDAECRVEPANPNDPSDHYLVLPHDVL